MSTKPLDYRRLLADLEEINSWLASLGITKYHRFRRYQANITEMIERQSTVDVATVFASLEAKGRVLEILSSYVEAVEFVDAIRILRQSGVQIPVQTLQRACGGPVDASVETGTSNAARNCVFELVMAAKLAAAGLNPTVGENPDLAFGLDGQRVLVECKRVLTEKKIRIRVFEAIDQIRNRALRANEFGVVAISVTRTINKGDGFWTVPRISDVGEFLRHKLIAAIRPLDERLQATWDPKIKAVLFYIASPVYVGNLGYTPGARGMVYRMPGGVGFGLLDSFASRIHIG